ncbi:MAG TPA: hypothetical protein VMI56_24240 [Reyranella sp.]|nr:hypothetical protein [Reyranella sp.]
MQMPSIDIVIPHVDGSAPGYEALARQYTGEFVPCQLRDLGEFQFVLRSIDKYARWANVILVVQSEGHVPPWLDRRSVRIVCHDEFIPSELLPTFHWATIAAHIHLIAGLSEQYVFWEDDVLAGAPLRPVDLFAADGLLGLNWTGIPIPFGLGWILGTYQLNLEETRRALCRMLGRRVDSFLYPHAPLPATRPSAVAFHASAMEDPGFRGTIARRSRGDERALPTVDPIVLYANWVEAKLRHRGNAERRWQAVRRLRSSVSGSGRAVKCGKFPVVNDAARMRRHMDLLRRADSRARQGDNVVFHNVNDEAYDNWSGEGTKQRTSTLNPASPRLLKEALVSLYPAPSRFETAA